ncbi:MAG: DUF4845 domain-containing protein [Rhodoferax sp.]|nr:DUF4845 domain-containing protein [Rhodoferax sp.]
MRSRHKQQGASFFGLLFVGGILVMLGVVAAQAFPTFVEYLAIEKAVQTAATGQSVTDVKVLFDKSAEINGIKSISGRDLEVSNAGGKIVVSFAYDREIHLVGPAFLTLKYAGRSK